MTELARETVSVVVVTDERVEADGSRAIYRGAANIALENDYEIASMAKAALRIRAAFPSGGAVAVLGGGFCILPRLLGLTPYRITIFEINEVLERYVPAGCHFILGRWQDTLVDRYDVIIHDTGEDLTEREGAMLAEHLIEGGQVITSMEAAKMEI